MSTKSTITNSAPASAASGRPRAIVLGIDPGTHVVGYGAVVDSARGPRFLAAGVFRAAASLSVARRLAWIQGELEALLARVAPDVVVVEQAFASRNIQSALRIGEGRGVILACAARTGADVVELAPAAAKKAVLGHGGADKTQVAKMVAQILGLKELPRALDATDALALALAHVQRSARGLPFGVSRVARDIDRALIPATRTRVRDQTPDRALSPWNQTRNKTLRGSKSLPHLRPQAASMIARRSRQAASKPSKPSKPA